MNLAQTIFRVLLVRQNTAIKKLLVTTAIAAAPKRLYSRRNDPKEYENDFKVVKSKARESVDESEWLGGECGPNWEILSPRSNRFFLPNAIGPAWQGVSTTLPLTEPLEAVVDFEGTTNRKNALSFSVDECPALIRDSLHTLFPVQEVASNKPLTLVILRFNGDGDKGAKNFVLAAREIAERLRLHGYWADFMNPFSGKPFYSWANGVNLYNIDDRFRGLNMKLTRKNECTIISTEDSELKFSGAIYTNAPADYLQLKLLIDEQVFEQP